MRRYLETLDVQNSAVEKLFLGFCLLLFIGSLTGLFIDLKDSLGGGGDDHDGNLRYQAVTALIYLICGFYILARSELAFYLVSKNKLYFLLLSLVLVSVLWSVEPTVSMRRGIALVGTSLVALYIVMRFEFENFLRLLAWCFLITAWGSILISVALPSLGQHSLDSENAWKGLFAIKNELGRMMALGAVTHALVLRDQGFPKWASISGFGACVFTVFMAQSATGIVVLASMLLIIPVLKRFAELESIKRLLYTNILFFLLLLAIYLVFAYLNTLTGWLGKDPTLSARTIIWNLAFEAISDRPLLGYGYRVFWSDDSAGWLFSALYWDASFSHSHNAFIDILLDVGFVGLGIFLLTVLVAARRIFLYLDSSNRRLALWFPLSLVFVLMTGITEETILKRGTIEWIIYTTTLLYLTPLHSSVKRNAQQMEGIQEAAS